MWPVVLAHSHQLGRLCQLPGGECWLCCCSSCPLLWRQCLLLADLMALASSHNLAEDLQEKEPRAGQSSEAQVQKRGSSAAELSVTQQSSESSFVLPVLDSALCVLSLMSCFRSGDVRWFKSSLSLLVLPLLVSQFTDP